MFCSYDHRPLTPSAQGFLDKFPFLSRVEQMTRIHLHGGECRDEDGRLCSVSEIPSIDDKVIIIAQYCTNVIIIAF